MQYALLLNAKATNKQLLSFSVLNSSDVQQYTYFTHVLCSSLNILHVLRSPDSEGIIHNNTQEMNFETFRYCKRLT